MARPSPSLFRSLIRTSTPRLAARNPSPAHIPLSTRPYHLPQASSSSSNIRPHLSPLCRSRLHAPTCTVRHESTTTPQPSHPHPATSTTAPETRLDRDEVPQYELTFTCKSCSTRSSHRISKQGYHHGTVLISCPGCKNRHLISDHMKIFSDKPLTVEDLMREKGQLVKRGSLSKEGDVEFWDDGSVTGRSSHFHQGGSVRGDEGAPSLTEGPGEGKGEKA